MTTGLTDDVFLHSDRFLVSVSKRSGSDVGYETSIESLKFAGFEEDFEETALLHKATASFSKGRKKGTVEITGLLKYEDSVAFNEFFMGDGTTSDGVTTVTSSGDSQFIRVSVLVTDDSTPTVADDAVTAGAEAVRWVWADGKNTKYEESLDSGNVVRFTLTFETTSTDADSNANYQKQKLENTSTGGLDALQPYTSSVKW